VAFAAALGTRERFQIAAKAAKTRWGKVLTHWSDPAVIVALIGVATALFYTILTGLIWHATWQNTRATRLVLEATQRPYLGINEAKIVAPPIQTGTVNIAVVVANVGTVPRRGIIVELALIFPGDADNGSGNIESGALFQGQKLTVSIGIPQDKKQFLSTGGFEVSVTVRYQGMTDKQYTTKTKYKYTGILGGFTIISGHFD